MQYSKEIIRHFRHPQNVGRMRNPDGLGKAGNLTCGDIMYLYIKIGKDKRRNETIQDIKFETFGCTVAIANTSLLTTLVKGKTLEEAADVTKEDLLKKFGQVPIVKIHCSMLAVDALAEAIHDYLSRNKKPISKKLREKHERIMKDRDIMEERHKELVGLEEELHKSKK